MSRWNSGPSPTLFFGQTEEFVVQSADPLLTGNAVVIRTANAQALDVTVPPPPSGGGGLSPYWLGPEYAVAVPGAVTTATRHAVAGGGYWDLPSTWQEQFVPGPGDTVIITGGLLRFSPYVNTQLTCRTLMVLGPDKGNYTGYGYLEAGTAAIPVAPNVTCNIGFLDTAFDVADGTPPPTSNTTNPFVSNPTTTPTVIITGTAASGGQLAPGTYRCQVTYQGQAGETLPSPESAVFTITTAGTIPQITNMPGSIIPNAIGVNIYLTPTNGASGSEHLYALGQNELFSTYNFFNDMQKDWNGLVVLSGKIRVFGAAKTPYVRLNQDVLAGNTTLIPHPQTIPSGWQPGDQLYLPDSRMVPNGGFAQNTGHNAKDYLNNAETVPLASVSPNTNNINLSAGLLWGHPAAHRNSANGGGVPTRTQDGQPLRPHCLNMTRNVNFYVVGGGRPVVDTQQTPYARFEYKADVDVRYAAFLSLGRTEFGPIGPNPDFPGSGFIRDHKYPVFFNYLCGPAGGQPNGFAYTFVGNVVDAGNPGFGDIDQVSAQGQGSLAGAYIWAITCRISFFGLIQNNIAYRSAAFGMGFSTGKEWGNLFDGNFVCEVIGSGLRADISGIAGNGFYGRGCTNKYTNNIANGCRYVQGQGVVKIGVQSGGSGYTSVPTVTFTGGHGTGPVNRDAAAHAVLSGGVVTAIVIDTPGMGYVSPPTVGLSGGIPNNPAILQTPVLGAAGSLGDGDSNWVYIYGYVFDLQDMEGNDSPDGDQFVTMNQPITILPNFLGADPTDPTQFTIISGTNQPIMQFTNNEAYGAMGSGMTAWFINSPVSGSFFRTAQPTNILNMTVWHILAQGYFAYPSQYITVDGAVMINDESFISANTKGLLCGGDYSARNHVVKNSMVENFLFGVPTCSFGYDMTFTSLQLCNQINFFVLCLGAPASASDLHPVDQIITITNCTYATPTGLPLITIYLEYAQNALGSKNLARLQRTKVVSHNKADGTGPNFNVYRGQQAANQIMPVTDPNAGGQGGLVADGGYYGLFNLTNPYVPSPTTALTVLPSGGGTTGGSLNAGSYTAQIVYLNAGGNTQATPPSNSFTVTSTGNGTSNIPRITGLPTSVANATGFSIFLSKNGAVPQMYAGPLSFGSTTFDMTLSQGTPQTNAFNQSINRNFMNNEIMPAGALNDRLDLVYETSTNSTNLQGTNMGATAWYF